MLGNVPDYGQSPLYPTMGNVPDYGTTSICRAVGSMLGNVPDYGQSPLYNFHLQGGRIHAG